MKSGIAPDELQPLPMPPEAARALGRFDWVGGVVGHEVFALPAPDARGLALHRAAAISALRSERRRSDAAFEQLARDAGRPREAYFQLTVDEARASGEPISVEQFLGPFYGAARGGIRWPGTSHAITGDDGYAYAFALPPYGLDASHAEVDALFRTALDSLFDSLVNVEIWQWTTDWSNAFDEGHEWWGAYLWTVLVTGRHIVAVLASTTD